MCKIMTSMSRAATLSKKNNNNKNILKTMARITKEKKREKENTRTKLFNQQRVTVSCCKCHFQS